MKRANAHIEPDNDVQNVFLHSEPSETELVVAFARKALGHQVVGPEEANIPASVDFSRVFPVAVQLQEHALASLAVWLRTDVTGWELDDILNAMKVVQDVRDFYCVRYLLSGLAENDEDHDKIIHALGHLTAKLANEEYRPLWPRILEKLEGITGKVAPELL